jgi:hypothetical protein
MPTLTTMESGQGGLDDVSRTSDSSNSLPALRRYSLDVPSGSLSLGDEEHTFAFRESRLVSCIRLVMLGVLVASAAGTAAAVYSFTRHSEHKAFEVSFENDSKNIVESMGSALFGWLGAIDAYATYAVSVARATNQTWPFVSIPDASVHLAKVRSLSKTLVTHQTHFVTDANKKAWVDYSVSHPEWMWDAIRVQPEDKNYEGVLIEDKDVFAVPFIANNGAPANGQGLYLPTWHSSPFVPCTCGTTVSGRV